MPPAFQLSQDQTLQLIALHASEETRSFTEDKPWRPSTSHASKARAPSMIGRAESTARRRQAAKPVGLFKHHCHDRLATIGDSSCCMKLSDITRMFDGQRAVNPFARQFSRAAGSCDKADFAGTSSRRTQLFTFQGARPSHNRPGHCPVRGKPFSQGVSILPAFHRLSTAGERFLMKIFAPLGSPVNPGFMAPQALQSTPAVTPP